MHRLKYITPLILALGFFEASFLTKSLAQIPGTKDIIKEFPEFTTDVDREHQDIIDFEYSRLVAISFHGNFDVVVGGLAKIMDNSFRGTLSVDYFISTQTATVLTVGFSKTSTEVEGETTVTIGGASQTRQLAFNSDIRLIPVTFGFRFYLGHPAHPSFFSALGIHAEAGGGIIFREEKFNNIVLEQQGGDPNLEIILKTIRDYNPTIYVNLGFEIPLVTDKVFLGGHLGYVLAFLSDEGSRGKAGEARDGDWATFGVYVMAHLF